MKLLKSITLPFTTLRDRQASRKVRDLDGFPLIPFQGLSEGGNGMGKQITAYDRMQAFTWLADKGLAKEMTVKGSYVNSLPMLYGMSTLKESHNGHTFIKVGAIDNVKEHYEKLFSPVTVISPWKHVETITISDKEKTNPAALIRDGKYLAVCVDLTHKKSKILADFEHLLDTIIPYIGSETLYSSDGRGKEKDFKYSIWRVYNMCTRTKKPNFTAVARALSKKSGQARDNSELAICLKAVKRAYKRADEIVKTVKKEITKGVGV